MSIVQEGIRVSGQELINPLVSTVAKLLGVPLPKDPRRLPSEQIAKFKREEYLAQTPIKED